MNTSFLGLLALGLATGCVVDAEADAIFDREQADESSTALTKNALTSVQQAQALKAIDDICGDTWCEGDHNFRFDRLQCRAGCGAHAGSCKLTFRIFSHDTDVDTGPTYSRSCTTPGFEGFESLVSTSGSYQSLTPEYYDALTDCIGRVESSLP